MNKSQEVVEFARSLFDVAGVSRLPDGGALLVLGLESTAERNLDDFRHIKNKFQLYGFKKYFQPKLNLLIDFIRDKGYSAETIGKYGYPLEGEINLKEHAVMTGIGKRGKNTIIIHPKFGTRLRFAAIKTSAPLKVTGSTKLIEEENPACYECTVCIDACPVKVLRPYRMTDIAICLSNVNPINEEGRSILCDVCLHLCPLNKT